VVRALEQLGPDEVPVLGADIPTTKLPLGLEFRLHRVGALHGAVPAKTLIEVLLAHPDHSGEAAARVDIESHMHDVASLAVRYAMSSDLIGPSVQMGARYVPLPGVASSKLLDN